MLQQGDVAWGLQGKVVFTRMPSGTSVKVGTKARPGLCLFEDVPRVG